MPVIISDITANNEGYELYTSTYCTVPNSHFSLLRCLCLANVIHTGKNLCLNKWLRKSDMTWDLTKVKTDNK